MVVVDGGGWGRQSRAINCNRAPCDRRVLRGLVFMDIAAARLRREERGEAAGAAEAGGVQSGEYAAPAAVGGGKVLGNGV